MSKYIHTKNEYYYAVKVHYFTNPVPCSFKKKNYAGFVYKHNKKNRRREFKKKRKSSENIAKNAFKSTNGSLLLLWLVLAVMREMI